MIFTTAQESVGNCSVYTATQWASREQWKNIPVNKLIAVAVGQGVGEGRMRGWARDEAGEEVARDS